MPTYAVQPQWRRRRAAIGKKGELDFELLMESELVTMGMHYTKHKASELSSPVTVAATLNASPTTIATANFADVPEMKPLPGAWVTVGKGGRPVKEALMYDEPATTQAKKKKRIRARKVLTSEDDDHLDSELAALEITSLQALDHSMKQHQKQVSKAKEGKFWIQYRHAKQLKVLQRDTLLAELAEAGMLISEGDDAEVRTPEPLKRRNDKGSSRGAKLRRQARRASAAARCYAVEVDDDDSLPAERVPAVRENKAKERGGFKAARKSGAEGPGAPAVRESSKGSSSDVEVPSRKRPAAPDDKHGMEKGKRNSKQCSVM